jgi:succinate dehydrogenase / fumarate reductase flavoprotein subunit
MKNTIIIVGAGLAGLSATLAAAENGDKVILVSTTPSERAQSVMAEGGINAALDTKDGGDSTDEHYQDTITAACGLADPNAVTGLVEAAPGIVRRLLSMGVLFNMGGYDEPALRYFGGQKRKRTAFAQSSTGKQIMTAMIQTVRKYESNGLVERYSRHSFAGLLRYEDTCVGCAVCDRYTGKINNLRGNAVIIATGGLHGLFGGTTGSLDNTGAVTAELFNAGIPIANGEFIQYHPTTATCSGKRLLISEAARGEGGRLFVNRNGKRWYFMEEKYPELGNLMPRDVVSREMWALGEQVFLDMTNIQDEILKTRLCDTMEDCMTYLRLDPRKDAIPVSPGIHYFMGGIAVDERHATKLPGLYAAGECCCQYHGANRLGGNSLLGAIYGGLTAAKSASETPVTEAPQTVEVSAKTHDVTLEDRAITQTAMRSAMALSRNKQGLEVGLAALGNLAGNLPLLGRAMIMSALAREESRGAHLRSDFPERNDVDFCKTTVAVYDGENISVRFDDIPERRL